MGEDWCQKANLLEDRSKLSNTRRGNGYFEKWYAAATSSLMFIRGARWAACQGYGKRVGWGLGLLEQVT